MAAATEVIAAYLRLEAELAQERSTRLRALAEAIFLENDASMENEPPPPGPHPMGGVIPAEMHEEDINMVGGKKKGKRRKRNKDPNKMKRGKNAYTLFVSEKFAALKQADPERASREIITDLARQWSSIPAEEKLKYKERAAVISEEEMQAWMAKKADGGVVAPSPSEISMEKPPEMATKVEPTVSQEADEESHENEEDEEDDEDDEDGGSSDEDSDDDSDDDDDSDEESDDEDEDPTTVRIKSEVSTPMKPADTQKKKVKSSKKKQDINGKVKIKQEENQKKEKKKKKKRKALTQEA